MSVKVAYGNEFWKMEGFFSALQKVKQVTMPAALKSARHMCRVYRPTLNPSCRVAPALTVALSLRLKQSRRSLDPVAKADLVLTPALTFYPLPSVFTAFRRDRAEAKGEGGQESK